MFGESGRWRYSDGWLCYVLGWIASAGTGKEHMRAVGHLEVLKEMEQEKAEAVLQVCQ